MKIKLIVLKERKHPICPECGNDSIVGFTPPKPGIVGTPEGYRTIGTPEYIDWSRAHLYCSRDKNCKFNIRFIDLT